jgi:putative endonuclease
MPFTYILRCADGTLYVGHTRDLAMREEYHNLGIGSLCTARRLPVRLAYWEEHATIDEAVDRERQIKGWSSKRRKRWSPAICRA